MKLLFVVPNQLVSDREFFAEPHVCLPLGVLFMAAYLRQQQWDGEMEVYDARLSGLLHKDENDIGLFGDTDERMGEVIKAFDPDVVGISNMFTSQFPRALKAAEIVKRVCPKAVTVLGGPHVSSFPTDIIKEPTVDFVVIGEGEERMLALMHCLENGQKPAIQGVMQSTEDEKLLKPGKIQIDFIKSLDDLPLPAYDMVDVERYFELQSNGYSPRPKEWGNRSVTILTSRGCPHQCIFCSIQVTMGYRWRYNSVDYIINHIEFLRENYQIDFIHFEDDNFTHDPERYDEIINKLTEAKSIIPWDTPNGVRGDTWTHDRVRRTKASGCQYLTVAIESTSQHVIDTIVKKRLDLSQVQDLMRYCKQEKLRLNAFYMIGLPGETLDDIKATVDDALENYWQHDVWPVLSIAMPLPGTELFDIVMSQDLHVGDDSFGYGTVQTDHFTPKQLNDLYKKHTRKKMLIFSLKTFTSFRELSYNLHLMIRFRSSVWRNIKRTVFGIVNSPSKSSKSSVELEASVVE